MNLKWALTCFERVSGMKINYNKSELIPLALDADRIVFFVEIFGCALGNFPIKYLGIPLHYDKLRRELQAGEGNSCLMLQGLR
jgi:hypothetical protein